MIMAYTNGRYDFSRRREQELSISRMFVRLNVLDYEKARGSDQYMQKLVNQRCVKGSYMFEDQCSGDSMIKR